MQTMQTFVSQNQPQVASLVDSSGAHRRHHGRPRELPHPLPRPIPCPIVRSAELPRPPCSMPPPPLEAGPGLTAPRRRRRGDPAHKYEFTVKAPPAGGGDPVDTPKEVLP